MNVSLLFKKCLVFLLFFNLYYTYGQITINGSTTPLSIISNTNTSIAPELTVTASVGITDFTVSITDSYSTGDVISYSPGDLPSGVTVIAWNTTTRSIVFKGTKTAAEWQSFLRTVTVMTGSVCTPETRKVSFVAGQTYYNPINGHFYRLSSNTSSWSSAQSSASSTSFYGREGYLVTLTTIAENTFVSRLVGQNSWMGASDDYLQINNALGYTAYANQSASEGKFFWVTGPEKGTQLTTNNGSGNTLPGVYQNWRNGEPNNSGTEHYGHVYAASGDWNDFANTQNIYSIMEFGDMPNDVTSTIPQFTKNISIQGSSSGSIAGGNVTVCSGVNSTSLTLSGLTGTVVRWEKSNNNFITTGTTIANTTTSLIVSNISETTYYRAVVNSTSPSSCSGLVTSSTPIYVSNPNSGNVFANNTTICSGADVELYVSGQEGTIQKWQRSMDNSTWTDIVNTNTTLTETVSNVGTLYYRVFVEVSGCGSPVASPSKQITVVSGTAPIGGQVSSNTHYSTTNSGTLSITGYTGTITKWQKSTDDGIIWTDISNTSTTNNYSNIAVKTLFRAQLTNGSCGTTYSNEGSVSIASAPSIANFTPKLAGNGETITITGTGFTGVTSVAFGSQNATSFNIISDTEITAIVGVGASGSVTVTNPGGNDSEVGFTYKVAEYKFENNALDETENNYDGQEINAVSYNSGAQGQAICFDNGPGYVKLPDNLIRNLTEFTISLRFKTTGTGSILGYQNVTTLNSPITEWIPIIMITSDGKLKGTLWTSASNSLQAISANTVNDGNWHQVDFTGGTNSVSIYLDGNLQATKSGASVAHLSMSYNQLGLSYTNNYNTPTNTTWEYFDGCIDNLVIIDRELTQLEIEEITQLPEPTITSFTPTGAKELDQVVITGTNFDGATQVTFGGVNASSYTVDSATQITAVLGEGSSGAISVITAGGTALINGFNFYYPPTEIAISNAIISENEAIGTEVGQLTTTDANTGETFTYTLVSGTGDDDNASFAIDSDKVNSAVVFDYETKTSYSIRIEVEDSQGLTFEKIFTITISDVVEDADNDSVNDSLDLCPNTPTGETVDANGCSATQKDTDNDSVNDSLDLCPNTPTGETVDANGCSATQKDSDGDGINDAYDAFPNDPNEDTDTDGDGTGDNADAFPNDPNEDTDTDGDGTGDNADAFPNDPNEDTDSDGDGTGDNADAFPNDPNEDTDTDNDGIGDNADAFPNNPDFNSDLDGDGVSDEEDIFPNDPNESIDTDNDGIGDAADLDDDNDGYSDEVEINEGTNPKDANDFPIDTDNDGIPDSLDSDDDNDGIDDLNDSFPTLEKPSLIPAEAFTPNGDGINDTWMVPGINNYPNNIVRVYNRWGHEVFMASNYQNNWTGSHKSNREILPAGSYLYVIDLGNGSAPQRGWIFINY